MVLKFLARAGLAALALGVVPAGAQAQLGGDAAVCRARQPSILVNVVGLSRRSGNIRVALYNNPSTFLDRGQTLRKVNVPVTAAGPIRVCIAVPRAGQYAIAVRHDVDGDNARGDWSDGGGFTRNPRLSLMHLRPRFGEVAVNVGQDVLGVNVVLNYRFGLSIRPVNG
ncbi:MAG: hypothetical protein QOH47_1949 [Sphingomonadales bacterium]|jgi:uncharacterized protein (DUF2141 family)|nr:hypothetical protein [Sphingomonadales bacterium]